MTCVSSVNPVDDRRGGYPEGCTILFIFNIQNIIIVYNKIFTVPIYSDIIFLKASLGQASWVGRDRPHFFVTEAQKFVPLHPNL